MDGDGGGDDLASPAPLLTLGDATPIPPWIPRANAHTPKIMHCLHRGDQPWQHRAEETVTSLELAPTCRHQERREGRYPTTPNLPAQAAPSSSGRALLSPEGRWLQAGGGRGSHGSKRALQAGVVGWKRGCAEDKRASACK